jgi:hypothetical protein
MEDKFRKGKRTEPVPSMAYHRPEWIDHRWRANRLDQCHYPVVLSDHADDQD